MADILYTYKNSVYLNLTNRCTCSCIFCIRSEADALGSAENLWHDHDPSWDEIREAIDAFDFSGYPEAVFCGYGEPTCAYENLLLAAKYLKQRFPAMRLRLNTNGLGQRYNHASIIPELAAVIDAVSISLNAPNTQRYQEVSRPCYDDAFSEVLAFAQEARKYFSQVQFSVVSILTDAEIEACRALAAQLGIPLRVRQYS